MVNTTPGLRVGAGPRATDKLVCQCRRRTPRPTRHDPRGEESADTIEKLPNEPIFAAEQQEDNISKWQEREVSRTKTNHPRNVIPDLVRDPVKLRWLVCYQRKSVPRESLRDWVAAFAAMTFDGPSLSEATLDRRQR